MEDFCNFQRMPPDLCDELMNGVGHMCCEKDTVTIYRGSPANTRHSPDVVSILDQH